MRAVLLGCGAQAMDEAEKEQAAIMRSVGYYPPCAAGVTPPAAAADSDDDGQRRTAPVPRDGDGQPERHSAHGDEREDKDESPRAAVSGSLNDHPSSTDRDEGCPTSTTTSGTNASCESRRPHSATTMICRFGCRLRQPQRAPSCFQP